MYYHILIETTEKIGKSQENKRITSIDNQDKKEIIMDIIAPYLDSEEFIVNGFVLKKSDISRFKILETEKSARELSQYENDHMPSGLIMYVSSEDILDYEKYAKDVTKEFIELAKIPTGKKDDSDIKKVISNEKVFIVHGHDNSAKSEVARFVERLGFEAIILHEQVNAGMTIIDKIEKFTDVGFAVVLYTPCDVGYIHGKNNEEKARARQNVVFEHGYLISRIGRNRVCALIKGDIEIPTDMSGLLYIILDEQNGWKIPLAKEMKSAGYDIDFNLVI